MEVHARMAAKLRDQIGRPETTNQIGKKKRIGQEREVRQTKMEAITNDCVSTPQLQQIHVPIPSREGPFCLGVAGQISTLGCMKETELNGRKC